MALDGTIKALQKQVSVYKYEYETEKHCGHPAGEVEGVFDGTFRSGIQPVSTLYNPMTLRAGNTVFAVQPSSHAEPSYADRVGEEWTGKYL